jgi:hypothetical protein
MKIQITVLMISLASIFAFAQTGEPQTVALPTTLKATMKAMASDLKTIAAQVTNPQANENSASLADDFVKMVTHAKDFTPDMISSLPADQQAAEEAKFDKQLDDVAALGTQMAAALRANDNAKASNILNQLVQAKKDGHDEFKQ